MTELNSLEIHKLIDHAFPIYHFIDNA